METYFCKSSDVPNFCLMVLASSPEEALEKANIYHLGKLTAELKENSEEHYEFLAKDECKIIDLDTWKNFKF
jgi:hypothetical protein